MDRRGKKPKGWSYVTGQKGKTRVRAFRKRRGVYFVEWYDHEGRRVAEYVGSDPDLAKRAADRKVAELELDRGPGRTVTLRRLLDGYHAAHREKWSSRHKKDQEAFYLFWLDALGEKSIVGPDLTPATVESKVQGRGWGGRYQERHLKYIRAAVRWGYRKARWLDRDHLDGVDYPKYESQGVAYSTEELDAISKVAAEIDPRFRAIWEIMRDTGRRVGSVRQLRVDQLDFTDEDAAVNWPAETVKERKRGRNYVTDETRAAIEELLKLDAVLESGWLFPERPLNYRVPRRGPIGDTALAKMLRAAEEKAKVKHIEGRAFHGVKRRAVTELMRAFNGDADKVGVITGNIQPEILQETYRQVDDQDRKDGRDVARKLRELRPNRDQSPKG